VPPGAVTHCGSARAPACHSRVDMFDGGRSLIRRLHPLRADKANGLTDCSTVLPVDIGSVRQRPVELLIPHYCLRLRRSDPSVSPFAVLRPRTRPPEVGPKAQSYAGASQSSCDLCERASTGIEPYHKHATFLTCRKLHSVNQSELTSIGVVDR
jgi:hypothetical protein